MFAITFHYLPVASHLYPTQRQWRPNRIPVRLKSLSPLYRPCSSCIQKISGDTCTLSHTITRARAHTHIHTLSVGQSLVSYSWKVKLELLFYSRNIRKAGTNQLKVWTYYFKFICSSYQKPMVKIKTIGISTHTAPWQQHSSMATMGSHY